MLIRALFCALVVILASAGTAAAQSLGTFTWQLQPYCNILTLTVTHMSGTYALDGFDDQCGASTRAAAIGTAFQNPDGTIGLGVSIVTTPGASPVHVDATISLATLSGTWKDSHFLSGTFAFGATSGVATRPSFEHTAAAWSIGTPAQLLGVRVNGTRNAPLSINLGDKLAVLGGGIAFEYGVPTASAHMAITATQIWSGAGVGAKIDFLTVPNGAFSPVNRMVITDAGNVGIGTQSPADRLDVSGDIRLGTALLNGCVKRNDGSALIGSCSSDARFKRDITPFAPALDAVARLRPVHYYWRADEFPAKAFGRAQTYGLIAQDVATVLPELVATDADGYKTVDYAKLPLLAIQAIKELTDRNAALEQRLAALESALRTLSSDRRHH